MSSTRLPYMRPWLALVGIAVLAATLRLAHQSELAGSPFQSGLMGDSREYDAWAQRIASGDWIGTDVFYQAPLYPYFLAVVFSLAGHDLALVRVLQALLGAVSCLL